MGYSVGGIEATLTLDRKPFQAGLRAARKDAEDFGRRRHEATLDADARPAQRRIGRLAQSLRRLGNQESRPKVDADTAPAHGRIKSLAQSLRKMGSQESKPKVDIDTTAANTKLAAISQRMRSIPDGHATVHVRTEKAEGGLGRVSGRFKMMAAAGVAATALVSPPALAAAAAVGGVGVAALGVLAPLGLLGLAMKTAFGKGAKGKGATEEGKAFRRELKGLRKDFLEMMGPAVKASFQGLTSMFKNLRTTMPGLRGSFTRLGESVKKVFTGLGKHFASPTFKAFAKEMIGLSAKAVPQLGRALGNLGKIFENISRAAGPLVVEALKKLADWLGKIAGKTSNIDKLRETFRRGVKVIGDVWKAVKKVAGVLLELGKLMPPIVQGFGDLLKIAAPLVKVVVKVLEAITKIPVVGPGIAAIGAAFLLWPGPLMNAVGLLKGIPALLAKIKGSAVVGSLLGKMGLGASAGAGAAGAATGASATAAKTAGGAAGGGFLAGMMAKLKALPSKIGGAFKKLPIKGLIGKLGIVAGIAAMIPGAVKGAKELVSKVTKQIKEGKWAEAGMSIVKAFAKSILGPMGSLMPKGVKKIIGKAFDPKTFQNIGKKLGVGIAKGFKKAKELLKAAKDLVKKVLKAVVSKVKDFVSGGKKIIGGVAKGIKAKAKDVWNGVKKVVTKAWKAVTSKVKDFVSGGKKLIAGVAKGIKAKAKKVWDGIKTVVKKGVTAVKDAAKGFVAAGKAIVEKIVEGIKAAAGKVAEAVQGVISGARDLLPFSEPKNRRSALFGLAKSGDAMVDNIGGGVRRSGGRLRRTMNETLRRALKGAQKAARDELAGMDADDQARQGRPPTRAERQGEVHRRIAEARGARDDRGRLLNQPPPGVKRVASADEREAQDEMRALQREFRREDLEQVVNMNVKTLIPSDPRTMREVKRGMGRAKRHGKRRKPRRRRR